MKREAALSHQRFPLYEQLESRESTVVGLWQLVQLSGAAIELDWRPSVKDLFGFVCKQRLIPVLIALGVEECKQLAIWIDVAAACLWIDLAAGSRPSKFHSYRLY